MARVGAIGHTSRAPTGGMAWIGLRGEADRLAAGAALYHHHMAAARRARGSGAPGYRGGRIFAAQPALPHRLAGPVGSESGSATDAANLPIGHGSGGAGTRGRTATTATGDIRGAGAAGAGRCRALVRHRAPAALPRAGAPAGAAALHARLAQPLRLRDRVASVGGLRGGDQME